MSGSDKIPPPVNPSMGNFANKITDEEKEKLLNPTGFLDENAHKKYGGIDKEGNLMDQKDIAQEKLRKEDDETDAKWAHLKPKGMKKEYGFKSKGPEPTAYGDWSKNGRCSDF